MTVKDLAEVFPERFNNKTNGVTPRRWLLLANPALAAAISEAIGDGWITNLGQLSKLKPLAEDKAFRDAFRKAAHETKSDFANRLKASTGELVDPGTVFDCQVKRIHEYKRQLLNALRIVVLYNRMRQNPIMEMTPGRSSLPARRRPPITWPSLLSSSSITWRAPSMATR